MVHGCGASGSPYTVCICDLAQCDTLRVQAHSFRDSFIHCATAANIFTAELEGS